MITGILLVVLVLGVNITFWGTIGLLRRVEEFVVRVWPTRWRPRRTAGEPAIDPPRLSEVAVLIAAHNEELVIGDSLRAICALVDPEQVYVVSDGSTDQTVTTARERGVNVIATATNIGKAGALREGIIRFELVRRYRVVMLLDADTRVDPGYFAAALPMFARPEVVAVAGCVRTILRGRGLGTVGQLLVCHRQRVYAITQRLLKVGQTWRRFNATHIVPGFASLYRTEVLPAIEMNPPGLVIEDFNMTFELYQKRLGKVAFTPHAVAVTQDPDNLRDYVRQTKRWALGLWQTVRRHPPRWNLFTGMLVMLLLEQVVSSLMFVLLPLVGFALLVATAVGGPWEVLTTSYVTPLTLLFAVVVPDLALTVVVAALERRPRVLLFAPFFLALRIIDAGIALYAIPAAWLTRSDGRWKSPLRRVDPEHPSDGIESVATGTRHPVARKGVGP